MLELDVTGYLRELTTSTRYVRGRAFGSWDTRGTRRVGILGPAYMDTFRLNELLSRYDVGRCFAYHYAMVRF